MNKNSNAPDSTSSNNQRKRRKNNNGFAKNNVQSNKTLETNDGIKYISNICSTEATFEKQLQLIMYCIGANEDYYKYINYIVCDMKHIMSKLYPQSSGAIYPFGSAITELALKDSDVDLFISFKGTLPENFVQSLKRAINKTKLFFRPIAIPARIPILRCEHSSNITCDISYTNYLGVANSNLIKSYLGTDDRLRPVILILKYFMKYNGLVSASRITSFSLILLILFYFQQLDKPLIPSAYHLQKLTNSVQIVANWNVSFVSISKEQENLMTIPQLIKGFFKFYSTFEFGLYIISTFTGKSYLKPIFANEETIPDEFYYYKYNLKNKTCDKFELAKYMCVQGPFNHAHNTSRNVTLKTLLNFQTLCQNTSSLLSNIKTSDKNKFLQCLFQQCCDPKKINDNVSKDMIFMGENIDFLLCEEISEDILREHWCNIILQKLIDILTKVLKIRVTFQTTDDTDIFKLLLCEFDYPQLVTRIRKNAKDEFDFPQQMSVIDKEMLISDYLCDTVLKNIEKNDLKFMISCYLLRGPVRVKLTFSTNDASKKTLHLIEMVYKFIQNCCLRWLQAII